MIAARLSSQASSGQNSGVRVRFVVNLHQLPDGRVRILLRCRERLMSQQLLNRPEVRAIRQQMRRKRVPQRVRMQVPINVHEPHILLNQAPHRTL